MDKDQLGTWGNRKTLTELSEIKQMNRLYSIYRGIRLKAYQKQIVLY